MRRAPRSVAAALALAVAAVPAQAAPITLGPTSLASGLSPWTAGCGGPDEALPSSVNYLSSEVETHVAVNPTNANNVAGYSFDGGLTWARSWPAFTRCPGGTGNTGGYERGTDPWVSFSPNARLHTMALVTWVGANDGNLANRTDVFHRPGG